MESYKIYINDRNYTSWEVFESSKFNKHDIQIHPLEAKLFTNDVFSIDKATGSVELLHSSIRCGSAIPGVLILTGNKTYGRQRPAANMVSLKKSTTQGRLLYKCIPDDVRLPSFLVPYEIKNIGFSKVFKNLYVTFNFDEWTDKHPYGKLDNVIGPIDVLDNFYEYQLYCKSLNTSIQKFQKDTTKALENKSGDNQNAIIEQIRAKYPGIEDRTHQEIITIDPPKSLDYDDGVGLVDLGNGIQQLSIYISNVTVWLDILNLWDSFSRRISTIYLPDKKRPMLPTILSDCLCSLQENVTRVAFVMDVKIDSEMNVLDISYKNAFVRVKHNYVYEDHKLLASDNYHKILDIVRGLNDKYQYTTHVRNSHDLICYLMIFMNYNCAKELIQYKTGIFRSTIIKNEFKVPDAVPEEVAKFIKIWNSAAGQYIDGSEIVNTRHEVLDMDAYIHITSPIRRLVDLLNMIKFQQVTGVIALSDNVNRFYTKWLGDLEYINATMRSIRKVQCDCSLLDLCHNNPEVMEKEYDGYLFDKITRNDGLFQYIAYLPELKLSSRVTIRDDFENFTSKKMKLFLFNDEEKFKRKIRIHIHL